MKKRNAIKKLGRKASHRKSLMINQVTSLFQHGKIETTTVKAKVLRTNAQRLISKYAAEKNDLLKTRLLLSELRSPKAITNFVNYVAKGNNKVTIVKTGFRPGDNGEKSEVALVGFVKEEKKVKAKKVVKATKPEKKTETEAPSSTTAKETKEGGFAQKLSKSIKETFTGSKQRVRTRSGL